MESSILQYVLVQSNNHVAYVTLANPPVNALSQAVIRELKQVFEQLARDSETKAIVLSGQGKAFAAGADIKEFTAVLKDEAAALALASSAQTLFQFIEQLRKPVIAAIHGPCLGGGLELALSCHLRIAAEQALLGLPELKLGLIPGYGGTQRLARVTNKAKALELILTSQPIDAAEAERIGLVNRTVPKEQLLEQATQWAELIASEKGTASVAAAIEAVMEGANMELQEGLQLEAKLFGSLFETEDANEGINAFLEKRSPTFKDR